MWNWFLKSSKKKFTPGLRAKPSHQIHTRYFLCFLLSLVNASLLYQEFNFVKSVARLLCLQNPYIFNKVPIWTWCCNSDQLDLKPGAGCHHYNNRSKCFRFSFRMSGWASPGVDNCVFILISYLRAVRKWTYKTVSAHGHVAVQA